MRHLVIGQRQKAPNFSAFHWSPHVTTRVVHLPKRTETSLITESDRRRANHQLLQLCTVRTAWSDSDQAVRALHSCKSWFYIALKFRYHVLKKLACLVANNEMSRKLLRRNITKRIYHFTCILFHSCVYCAQTYTQ